MTVNVRSAAPLSQGHTELRRLQPVKIWAVLGAGFVVLQIYVFSAWILSGDATPTPNGPTPIPAWMKFAARAWEAGWMVGVVLAAYLIVFRPWRRDGRPSADGILVIAFSSLYWQDPLINYSQTVYTYNTAFVNFGAWSRHIPGWISPRGNLLPEPVLGIFPLYAVCILGTALAGSLAMRAAHRRWPHLGVGGLILIAIGAGIAADLVLEPLWLLPGLVSYPGAIESMTLFHGHRFQYPIYEGVLGGAFFGVCGCLRYFKNDRGESIAERGLSELPKATRRQGTALRLLAAIGVANVIYLGVYNLPMQVFSLHGDDWPADVLNRSYLSDQFCGPGTPYACSGPGTPIPRPNSAHLDPSGQLIPARP
jgi:hypothetical protein